MPFDRPFLNDAPLENERLASACQIFAGPFVWSRIKALPNETPSSYPLRVRLLYKLVQHGARLKKVLRPDFDELIPRFKALFSQSAPTLREIYTSEDLRVSQLNGSIVERIEAPGCPELVCLLQTGCPKLWSLTLNKPRKSLDLGALILAIKALPNLRELGIVAFSNNMQCEIVHAVAGRLQRLSITGSSLTSLFKTRGMKVLDLSVSETNKLFLDELGMPSCSRIAGFGADIGLCGKLMLDKGGVEKDIFSSMTSYLDLLAPDEVIEGVETFLSGRLRTESLCWAAETLIKLLTQLQTYPFNANLRLLARCVVHVASKASKIPNPPENLQNAIDKLIQGTKVVIEVGPCVFYHLFEAGRPVPIAIVEALLGDPSWVNTLELDFNATIGGEILRALCVPEAIPIFCRLDELILENSSTQ